MQNEVRAEKIRHNNEERLKLVFPYNEELINKVKTIPGRRWGQRLKCWHIPNKEGSIQDICSLLRFEKTIEGTTTNTQNVINDGVDESLVKSKQIIASIKFYYERVLGRGKMFFNLKKAANIKIIRKLYLFLTSSLDCIARKIKTKNGFSRLMRDNFQQNK